MTNFSKELIDRTIKYFGEKHDHHITEDTANEYLASMARLYEAMESMVAAEPKDNKLNK